MQEEQVLMLRLEELLDHSVLDCAEAIGESLRPAMKVVIATGAMNVELDEVAVSSQQVTARLVPVVVEDPELVTALLLPLWQGKREHIWLAANRGEEKNAH